MLKIWKKIRYWLFWTGFLAYTILIMGAVADKGNRTLCQAIRVDITDSLTTSFVQGNEIVFMLLAGDGEILGRPLKEINTLQLEKLAEKHPFVQRAEAYKTSDGILHLSISQRRPLLRLLFSDQREMYLDEEGNLIPLSKPQPAHILICTGYLPDPGPVRNATPVDQLKNPEWYRQIYKMALYIRNNSFWEAQFEQIYIRSDRDAELVPRVGAHMILLGSMEGYAEKLNKLMVLYHEGFSRVGWNQYEWINLKYKNQVICTKK